MATGVAADGRGGPSLYRLTVEQYLQMIGAGVFDRGPRVELLGGMLVEKMTKRPPHNFGVAALADRLRAMLPPDWCVREEKSMSLDQWSRPEPDVVVARGRLDCYRYKDPKPEDVVLVVEVADSSYTEDRGEKYFRYAAAKAPAYAILNIPARRLQVFTKPVGRGPSARYREAATHEADAEFPVVTEGRELGRIAVRDVLA